MTDPATLPELEAELDSISEQVDDLNPFRDADAQKVLVLVARMAELETLIEAHRERAILG